MLRSVILALALTASSAFVQGPVPRQARTAPVMAIQDNAARAAAAAAAATLLLSPLGQQASAITSDTRNQLSYEQTKGTGLANRCNEVVGSGSIAIGTGQTMVDFCMEPKAWSVEEETVNKKGDIVKSFVGTKLMTRQTYTLDQMQGPIEVKDGKVTFTEKDGIDYAPVTVQLPGGERVPFLFTVKELVAKGSTGGSSIAPGFQMGGAFTVPSYRTGLFLDPKGRGMTTGYDMAQALPALQTGAEEAELFSENNKVFDVFQGNVEFEVSKVDADAGEIGGVFVSTQPSDTDMGGKDPKNVLSKGIFYGKIVKD